MLYYCDSSPGSSWDAILSSNAHRDPDNVPEWENVLRAFPITYKKSRDLMMNSWAIYFKSDVDQILEHDEF